MLTNISPSSGRAPPGALRLSNPPRVDFLLPSLAIWPPEQDPEYETHTVVVRRATSVLIHLSPDEIFQMKAHSSKFYLVFRSHLVLESLSKFGLALTIWKWQCSEGVVWYGFNDLFSSLFPDNWCPPRNWGISEREYYISVYNDGCFWYLLQKRLWSEFDTFQIETPLQALSNDGKNNMP